MSPLGIGVFQWYAGDPIAARFNWFEVGINIVAWGVLIATWPRVKKSNRETYAVFDQVVHTFTGGSKIVC
jgi:hypothetical protein